jgi:hypothetical protein
MRELMNPFFFVVKVGAVAFVTAAGTAMVLKKLCPNPGDLTAGAIHFKKGLGELHRGFRTIFWGASQGAEKARALAERKASGRIPIE